MSAGATKRAVLRWSLPAISGVCFLALWALAKWWWNFPKFFLPYPWEVAEAGWAERARLFRAATSTMSGALIGFAAAALAGGLIGVLLASSRWMRVAFYPHVLIVQMFPIVVLAPLFVLWFRAGIHSVSAIAFVIGFFPVVANATQGLISTDRNMVDLFHSTGANFLQEFLWLRVPFAMPYYLVGLRISASLAMIGAVTGELFAGSASGGSGGLGFMVIIYHSQLRTAEVLATGFVACLCGFAFVGSVTWLNHVLLRRWHDSIERNDV
ncbi:ABC transporter permease [Opitutales bacterium ASA1]|uniref:ABC transporter permease n=1 Tax=Congregicoccus parvus TaxID=3081749 RepID=UPI002B31DC72|nr:ABC transporter permease [Opitutales bacterium ASA1]